MNKIHVILLYIIIYLAYFSLWNKEVALDSVKGLLDVPWDTLEGLKAFFFILSLLFFLCLFAKIFFMIIAQKFKNWFVRTGLISIPVYYMVRLALRYKNNGTTRNILASPPMCYDPDEPVCMHLPPLAERWHEFFAYDCVQILFYILFTLIYFHVADQKKNHRPNIFPPFKRERKRE